MLINKKEYNAILTNSNYPCIGKYELDLATSCSVNCSYCGLKTDDNPRDLDISNLLKQELPSDIKLKGIYLSPNSDPFSKNTKNKTHQILEEFLPREIPFLIITKNKIPKHTIELMSRHKHLIYTQISLARLDNSINNILEPGAASSEDRLNTIEALVKHNIRVTTLLMPLYPGIDDTTEKLSQLINACSIRGNKYIKAAYLVINPLNKYKSISKIAQKMINNPILKKSYDMMTEETKINIGEGKIFPEKERNKTYALLSKLCQERDMKFYMCPILDPSTTKSEIKSICKTYQRYHTLNNNMLNNF